MTDEQHYQLGFTVDRIRDHTKFALTIVDQLKPSDDTKKILEGLNLITAGLQFIVIALQKDKP